MSWISPRSPDESLKIVREISSLCSTLGGSYSKRLNALLQDGKYSELINHKFAYDIDLDTDDILYARQIHALVAKQDYIDLNVDKEAVAFAKFVESEEKCRATNDRFYQSGSANADVSAVLFSASCKISDVLGDCPEYSSLDFSFGPGATTNVKHAEAHPCVKLNRSLLCSRELLPYVEDFLAEFPHLSTLHSSNKGVRIGLSHSKLVFVPKDSRTFRSIGIEPTLNGLGQKGIGDYIRRRLLYAGVDLSSQENNQRLALEGSISDALCTIDLASASDTISYNLVQDLLPPPWFNLLDRFRSGTVVYKDKIYELERFSSMGNAYTFELETLIFWSLCFGVSKYLRTDMKYVSVYGDDIIVPSTFSELLLRTLDYCGFTVNTEKSFFSGAFRESCGADFFKGFDIRPFYQKTLISDRHLYNMHNWFLRRGEVKLSKLVKTFLCEPFILYGPDGYGDGHLIGDYSLRQSRKMRRSGYCGGVFDTYTLTPKRFRKKPNVSYVYPLYCTYVSDPFTESDHNILPGTSGYHRISIYTLDRTVFRRPVRRVPVIGT
jgi:hypothetical protein